MKSWRLFQLVNCSRPYIMSDFHMGRWFESKQRKLNCVFIKVSSKASKVKKTRQGLLSACVSHIPPVILQKLQRYQKCTKIINKVSFEFLRQKSYTFFSIIWIFALKKSDILSKDAKVNFWRENSNMWLGKFFTKSNFRTKIGLLPQCVN